MSDVLVMLSLQIQLSRFKVKWVPIILSEVVGNILVMLGNQDCRVGPFLKNPYLFWDFRGVVGVLEEPGHVVEDWEEHDQENTEPSSCGRAKRSGLERMADDHEPLHRDQDRQVDRGCLGHQADWKQEEMWLVVLICTGFEIL